MSGPSLQAGHEYMADTTTNLHTCEDVVLAREVILETATHQVLYTCKKTETLNYPFCLKSAFNKSIFFFKITTQYEAEYPPMVASLWGSVKLSHVTAGADQWILPIIVSEYLFMFGHRVTGYTRQDGVETGVCQTHWRSCGLNIGPLGIGGM